MCNTCRDRYRNYGVTKRKKWKAERIAFDHELEQLRRAEDERRAKEGLVPLSESPEELRTWELSIIDEKVQLPPSLAAVLSTAASNAIAVSSPYHPLAIRQLNEALRGNLNAAGISTPLDQLTPIQIAQLAQLLQVRLDRRAMVDPIPLVVESIPSSTSNPDTSSQTIQSDNASSSSLAGAMGYPPSEEPRQPAPASPDNSQQLLESPSEATSTSLPVSASTLVLPQRMCTVSHCHTILPGHYLYKRCDRHRLQNRKHGKLKRVREKVVKEKGPDDDGDGDEESIDADAILQDDSEPFDDEAAERQKLEAKAREKAKQLMMARLAGTRKSRAKKPRKKEAPTAISTNSQDTEQAQPEDAPLPQIIPPGPTAGSNHVVNDKRRGYSCTAPGCSNLINPYFRWRMCEPCRALRKELRLGKKAEEEKQLKEAEEAYEKLGGAVVGATEAGQGSVDPEGYEGISDMETDIPPMDNGAQMNALSPEPTLFPTLTFKPFTPRDVEVSHEDDHGTLFGVLHSPDTELQPIDDSDDFVVRGQPGGGTLDSTTDSQPANSPPHTNLPHPCPNFTPALSQSTTSAYRPRPPSVRSNGAAQKPYKFVEGSRRNKRKSEGSQANDEQRNSVESTESQSNDPPGKKQRTKSQTAKGKGKAPVQPSIQSGYSYGPTTHMPYGSYYPYMTYPPTYGHPGYAMPPGSSNSTSISTSYSYTYPGYPGYPSYYPGYPYTTGYYPPPPTGFSPSAYLTPTAPNGDVTSATKEKKAETPQNRNTEAEGSTDLSISTESHSEDQPEPATNDTPREMILDIPTDNEQHPSPQTSFSAAPSPASTNTSLGIIRVVSRNKKGHSNTLAKKGSRDIFTNFTPELVRDNQGKRPKRSAPLFENAEERLKQIQASLARSNSDPEQMSPAESSSSSSPGLRMMFYRPRVEESVDIQKGGRGYSTATTRHSRRLYSSAALNAFSFAPLFNNITTNGARAKEVRKSDVPDTYLSE
ncbi:hypothetical protein VNI00_000856 [Paramarasmius palmivorus]|uniref:Uncharacterized protein n=1 Tax=Paramarasmius palmivorus TaxID=297713 RepID=A0AAW0E7A7_9AGAR